MDELLHQLISRIHQHEIGTQEYTIALEHLLALVPHLPGIRQDKHPEYSKAVDKTLEKIPRQIDKWLDIAKIDVQNTRATDLCRHFVNWVNMFLRNDIRSLYRAGKPPLSLDKPLGEERGFATHKDMLADHRMPMDCLELEEWQKQSDVLKRYIERDPDGRLRKCYPGDRPDCNCQVIAKERYLNDPIMKVPALAKQLGIHPQTIYSRWNRNCLPILREITENYHQYLYLLEPVPLSQWFQGVFDSGWQTLESVLGASSTYLVPSFRRATTASVKRCRPINLGMELAGNPVALVLAVTPEADDEIHILLRLCPTGEQSCLPPNLQLVVLDESENCFMDVRSRNADNWIQLKLIGQPRDRFSVKVARGNASVIEEFTI